MAERDPDLPPEWFFEDDLYTDRHEAFDAGFTHACAMLGRMLGAALVDALRGLIEKYEHIVQLGDNEPRGMSDDALVIARRRLALAEGGENG